MPGLANQISITELSRRSGVASSALRYYESMGLIHATRTEGNQRRYERGVLRRVAVIRVAQDLGLSLSEIATAFATLPELRDPTPGDWERLSRGWHARLGERIGLLERLRDDLSSCIGCGCLSLERCRLLNDDDRAAEKGAGPRYLLGDEAEER